MDFSTTSQYFSSRIEDSFEDSKIQKHLLYAITAFFSISIIFYLVIKYEVPLEELLASSILAACFLPLVIFSTLLLICIGRLKNKYCCLRDQGIQPELDAITTVSCRINCRNNIFPNLPTYQEAIRTPKRIDQAVQTDMASPPPYINADQTNTNTEDLSNIPPPEYTNQKVI